MGSLSVHFKINHSGIFTLVQNFLPGGAAILGAEDTALLIGTSEMTDRTNIHDLRISRMDDDPRDLAGVFQSDIGPALTAVHGFINSIAVGDVTAKSVLPRTDIKNLRICL